MKPLAAHHSLHHCLHHSLPLLALHHSLPLLAPFLAIACTIPNNALIARQ
jgi:hypothetical protein